MDYISLFPSMHLNSSLFVLHSSLSQFSCHSPPSEGILQYLLLALGSIYFFFPIADAHLDIPSRLKVAFVQMLLYVVKRRIDTFQHH